MKGVRTIGRDAVEFAAVVVEDVDGLFALIAKGVTLRIVRSRISDRRSRVVRRFERFRSLGRVVVVMVTVFEKESFWWTPVRSFAKSNLFR